MKVPTEVTEMEDHVNYYSTNQHKAAFDFLKGSHVTDLSHKNIFKKIIQSHTCEY